MEKRHISNPERFGKHHATDSYSLPSGMDKYSVLRLVKGISRHIGLTDSLIRQYELMIDYTSPIDWEEGNICICWLSVEEMSVQLEKSVRQVQYNNDKLVQLGLISMRLSGNYRRGGLRKKDGSIAWASGADMKVIIERLDEFQAIAETDKLKKEEHRALSKNINSLRREIRGVVENYWPEFAETAQRAISMRPRLSWTIDRLRELWTVLHDLWLQIEQRFTEENSDLDAMDCSHGCNGLQTPIQDTTQTPYLFVETSGKPSVQNEARRDTPRADYLPPNEGKTKNRRTSGAVSLGEIFQFIETRPDSLMNQLSSGGTKDLRQLIDAANHVRQFLGISPDAWQDACGMMGEYNAACHVVVIEAKGNKVRNPGGYLRGITDKVRKGISVDLRGSARYLLRERAQQLADMQ